MSLPYYYEAGRESERGTGRFAFSYFAEDMEFEVGGQRIPASEFRAFTLRGFGEEGTELGHDELSETPLMIDNCWPLLAGPKLHNWSPDALSVVEDEIVPVMKELYVDLSDEKLAKELNFGDFSGSLGFAAFTRENNSLGLQVLGNCACLGVCYPSGGVLSDDEQMKDGFAEYGLHNADTFTQVNSLYAGIGHLARRQAELA